MTKSELREITNLVNYSYVDQSETFKGIAARSLSALIRAARSTETSDKFWGYAQSFGVIQHPDFITGAAK